MSDAIAYLAALGLTWLCYQNIRVCFDYAVTARGAPFAHCLRGLAFSSKGVVNSFSLDSFVLATLLFFFFDSLVHFLSLFAFSSSFSCV